MYTLIVYERHGTAALDAVAVKTASLVLSEIPRLLASHPACERIEVRAADTLLFSVDCEGNRIE